MGKDLEWVEGSMARAPLAAFFWPTLVRYLVKHKKNFCWRDCYCSNRLAKLPMMRPYPLLVLVMKVVVDKLGREGL